MLPCVLYFLYIIAILEPQQTMLYFFHAPNCIPNVIKVLQKQTVISPNKELFPTISYIFSTSTKPYDMQNRNTPHNALKHTCLCVSCMTKKEFLGCIHCATSLLLCPHTRVQKYDGQLHHFLSFLVPSFFFLIIFFKTKSQLSFTILFDPLSIVLHICKV